MIFRLAKFILIVIWRRLGMQRVLTVTVLGGSGPVGRIGRMGAHGLDAVCVMSIKDGPCMAARIGVKQLSSSFDLDRKERIL